MKKLLVLLFILACTTPAFAQRVLIRHNQNINTDRILIVYYSPEDYVQKIAQTIHDKTDGDLFEIMTRHNSYPDNHELMLEQAAKEFEEGFLPELPLKLGSMERYDVIFIGAPVWNGHLPPAVSSFLRDYNLKGKMVIPFFSFDDDSDSTIIAELATQCKGCILQEQGFVTRQDDLTGLDGWLENIDFELETEEEN